MKIINQKKVNELNKIDIGGGRKDKAGFINLDKNQFVDGNDEKKVDVLIDIEKEKFPFKDGEIAQAHADNVLEHLGDGFIHCLNEVHRVLDKEGLFKGVVPVAGTIQDYKDPTHRRQFVKESFAYLVGKSEANPEAPKRPRYADYGIKPWREVEIFGKDQRIFFKLKPRK